MRRVVAIAVLLGSAPAHAGEATCSNPGLPIGATASSDLLPGRLTLDLATGILRILDHQVLVEPQGSFLYDARLSLVETRLTGEYVIASWLAAGFAMPYRVVDEHVTFRDPDTNAVIMPGSETIHARTETLHGVGDPTLFAHAAIERGGFRIHARGGLTLPLGGTVPDPFALGAIGQDHEHIQFGTGTFIPFLALEAQHAVGPVTAGAFALTYPSLYANDKGYKPGTRISGGVSASSGFGLRAWTFNLATEVHGETAERWSGKVYMDEGNAGRLDWLAGGGVAWRPLDALAFTADVRVPVHEWVVGAQLDYAYVASIGIVGTFDLAPRASWHGLDHHELAPTDDLVPVPGKLTVFDLYATWCAPCRRLDDELEALARRFPHELAVRKLDVGDPDSALWTRYLAPGHFDLPHVRVYGATGAIVLERTASPEELVRAIEELLRQGNVQVPS